MPKFRFVVDDPARVYEALVIAADAARETPDHGEVGPWDDDELRSTATIEVTGPDSFTTLVADRLIENDLGFEVEGDEVI